MTKASKSDQSLSKDAVSAESATAKSTAAKKMGMYLQDPSLPKLHSNYQFPVGKDYLKGTGSSRIVIQDSDEFGNILYPSLNWESAEDLSFEYFEDNGLIDNPQFHQVNTFAVLNYALDFVEEELGHNIIWKNGAALVVRPHAFDGANAYYDPMNPSLNFGYFTTPFRRSPVWTCLSQDIVTHELGHAILDTFRPLYIYSFDLDTPALHESFADLMAMFTALSNESMVKYLYRETRGNMRDVNLISRLAEEFGQGIFGAGVPYLRSALEGVTYTKAPKEAHSRSTVWTAAIYDILERLVKEKHPDGFGKGAKGLTEFSQALVKATRWIKGMLLRSLHYTPPNALTMPMLARLMIAADENVYPKDSRFRDIAKEVFVARELWNEKIDLSLPDKTVGKAFKGLVGADPTTLSRVIMQHADGLRIPQGSVRLIQPRLITTKRQIDKVSDGKTSSVKSITEHYLEYAYEQTEYVDSFGMLFPVTVYGGGTLMMNEQWNAELLSTYPEIIKEDPPVEAPPASSPTDPSSTPPSPTEPSPAQKIVSQSWRQARERFDELHGGSIQKTIAAREEKRTLKDRPVVAGCPFVLQKSDTGAYRLMRRNCSLHEHVKGVCYTKHGIVQP